MNKTSGCQGSGRTDAAQIPNSGYRTCPVCGKPVAVNFTSKTGGLRWHKGN